MDAIRRTTLLLVAKNPLDALPPPKCVLADQCVCGVWLDAHGYSAIWDVALLCTS